MKRTFVAICMLAGFSMVGMTATAKAKHHGPCANIMNACKAAGYKYRDHKKDGKGLFVDCVKKIMAGQPVQGVVVSPTEVQNCKAVRAKRKAKKEHAQ